ncbi:MAG: TetR/AcrR family transcriptional regulator [Bacteroidales bacterium]|nr:TetR/AcrR family transcriptional regulator [Bacteroidales bacterium]
MKKIDIRREIIVGKAQVLFQQYGFKKASMEDIANSCGKSKSTLYHYFDSKESVFNAVISSELVAVRLKVIKVVEKQDTTKEKVLTYLQELLNALFSKINIYRLVANEIRDKAVGDAEVKHIIDYETEYLTQLLTEGFDLGEYTNVCRKDISLFAEMIISAFFGIIANMLRTNSNISKEKTLSMMKIMIPQIFK